MPTKSYCEVLENKLIKLNHQLEKHLPDGIVLAFSGGVDSTFLLWIIHRLLKKEGGSLLALTTLSPSMPKVDFQDAKAFTQKLDIEHVWRNSQELAKEEYVRNDFNRCYFCKAELFTIAREVAKEKGYASIMYGYNASDKTDFRPGHKAALENNVLFPLAKAGLSKDEIRIVLRENGISISEKPASPCLSSRITHGIPVSAQILEDIEEIETILREEGIKIFRVRVCAEKGLNQKFLRIEVDPSEMIQVVHLRDKILEASTKRGYRWTTLDLQGYQTGGATF